ncbi:MAG: septation protein A [Alphaproteobacteria bacterium]|nr:septation protein A [Alphaproteobacteria bacterium]
MTSESASVETEKVNPVLKLALELGPLVVFFLLNYKAGIFYATGGFMIATVVSLTLSKLLLGKIAIMPLVTGVFVMVFGGLTLYLADDLFIKLKPTIVNCIFGTVLLGGLAFKTPLLKPLLGDAFPLDDEGWVKMTWRWGLFFFFLAMLNEIVWRNFSTDVWVNFKVFGIMPLTMLFAGSQVYFLRGHMDFEDETTGEKD